MKWIKPDDDTHSPQKREKTFARFVSFAMKSLNGRFMTHHFSGGLRPFLFLLLLLVGCGNLVPQDSYEQVTFTPPPTNSPAPPVTGDATGIARAFLQAWEAQDYLGMYSLLAPQSQALVDSQSFVTRYTEAMNTATVTAVHTQPLASNQQEQTAELSARITLETALVGPLSREMTFPLVYSGNRWGIVWNDGLILPELAGGNRLTLSYRTPARANIYDRNGLALAYQGSIISLGVIPGQIQDETGLLNALSPVLGQSPETIKESYAAAQPDWYWPLGEVTEDVLQTHMATLQPYIGAGLAPPQPRLTRVYNGAAPHIVGYMGPISAEQLATYTARGYRGDEQVGLAGLELWGEEYLNGERGGTLTVVGPTGEYITTLAEVQPQQARSLYATIDRDFQTAVEQALADAITSHPLAEAGSIIVLEVNSGKVLAMASYPTYHPAVFDTSRPNSAQELSAVLNAPYQPLLNRPTQGAYPAGSIFKIVTMTAGLNSGLYTPSTPYTSTGSWSRLGEVFIKYDWRQGGHGTVSLRQALVVSCNSCFYDVGFNLDGFDNTFLSRTARDFGFGAPTGLQIAESSGNIPDPQWKLNIYGEGWATGDSVNMAIGQGFVQVTPLQIVNMMAALANGGTLFIPTLVERIGAGGNAPEEILPPQTHGQLPLTPENLAVIKESLWNVTHSDSGTATDIFQGLQVSVAGKTGTAEDPPRTSHAWFAGYAPADPYTRLDGTVINQPEIAIVVMAENAGEGSGVAAPIFRRIVELYYGITPLTPFPW